MKKNIFLLIVFSSFLCHSQFGGRNQSQRQMTQIPQEAPEPNFNIDKYLGIVIYDIKRAAKKSGIKLSSERGKKFSTILTSYNKEVKDIRRINSFTLKSTKEMVDSFQKIATSTGDFSNQAKIQKTMGENLKPIYETLKDEDRKLDESVKEILSEKQYNKWIKYNRKIYKVFPKKEEK